jgi:hypothetical protein
MSSNNSILLKLTNQFEEAIYEVLKNRNILLDLERRLVDVDDLNPIIDESSKGEGFLSSSDQSRDQSTFPSSSEESEVQSTFPSSSGQDEVQSTFPSSSGQDEGTDEVDIKIQEKQKKIVMGNVENTNTIKGLLLQL